MKIKLLLIVCIVSCARPVYRSQQFYEENHESIQNILHLYNQLYEHQPFNFGFTDRSHRYVSIEIRTPNKRYIFNTAHYSFNLDTILPKFGIDTAALRKLAVYMHLSDCTWIGRQQFFKNGVAEEVNYLSFGAVAKPSLFSEQKFYVLGFPIHAWDKEFQQLIFKKSNITPINDSVFYTISNRFK